jgi:hypothetical protein
VRRAVHHNYHEADNVQANFCGSEASRLAAQVPALRVPIRYIYFEGVPRSLLTLYRNAFWPQYRSCMGRSAKVYSNGRNCDRFVDFVFDICTSTHYSTDSQNRAYLVLALLQRFVRPPLWNRPLIGIFTDGSGYGSTSWRIFSS